MFKTTKNTLLVLAILLFFGVVLVFVISSLIPEIAFFGFLHRDTKGAQTCDYQDAIDYYYYLDTDAVWSKNNKFGIYIYAENREYFEIAQELVNSNGGEWGYVLIPFNVKDDDYDKWHRVFSQLSSKRLIPIIQLWDIDTNNYEVQTQQAAEFLNSFLWPIKQRYISAYNEPNDSKFWYGSVKPDEYARILDYTITTFNNKNENFFMLNGALNTSSPSDAFHMDALEYLEKMNETVPGIFNKLDGWASHSYPQPNFSGDPLDSGRWSIQAYKDELKFLKESLGLQKELPVFITETGWAHAEGESYDSRFKSVNEIAEYFEIAYKEVWLKDKQVRAVTPFTIWYEPPFDNFSWVNRDKVPYLHYDVVKSLKKVKGVPPALQKDTINLSSCDEKSVYSEF